MIKRILLLLALVPEIVFAQTRTINNANPSINYSRLQRINGMINGYIKRDWIKGAITIIVKDG
jgi:hypothetical protein